MRNEEILLVAYDDATGLHYNYPGGGVEPGEGVLEALRREVREETGAIVTHVGQLLLVWEYVPARYGAKYGNLQKVGLVFECAIAGFDGPLVPAQPTAHQAGVLWAPLGQLTALPVLPNIAGPLLAALHAPQSGAQFVSDW